MPNRAFQMCISKIKVKLAGFGNLFCTYLTLQDVLRTMKGWLCELLYSSRRNRSRRQRGDPKEGHVRWKSSKLLRWGKQHGAEGKQESLPAFQITREEESVIGNQTNILIICFWQWKNNNSTIFESSVLESVRLWLLWWLSMGLTVSRLLYRQKN